MAVDAAPAEALPDRPKLFSTTGTLTCLEPVCGRVACFVGRERLALVREDDEGLV